MGGRMRVGLTISTIGHLLVLVWLLVTLPSTKIESTPALAVDMISDSELSQIIAGVKTAPKPDAPKPIVDKVGEPSPPVKDPTPKVSDKPEIQPTTEVAPPPEPKPEPKPEKAEAKPEKIEPQVDAIAEALKRDEAKKKEEAKKLADAKKKEEAKKRLEAKKREQEKFDAASIENRLALIDKRAPQRQAALGAVINTTPTLGADRANAMSLSQSEIDRLKARLADCWHVPVGVQQARDLVITVHFQLKKDGSLATPPQVINTSTHPAFRVGSESAVRAVQECAPFNFLPIAKFDLWQDLTLDFDPSEMFRS